MALPVTIPNQFANATSSIPLSQLDANFSTLANAVNGIANGSESLSNVSITGGSLDNVSLSNVTITTGNASVSNLTVTDSAVISVNSSSNALRITQVGSGNALLVEDSANPDPTPFVVAADGRVIAGTTSALTYSTSLTVVPNIQLNAIGAASYGVSRFSANSSGNNFFFLKSRSASTGSFDVVSSGDTLGTVTFLGADGTDGIQAAQITAAVDGTPGTNDMPGRLVFSTTADGASTPTEAMRIGSNQAVGIGTTTLTGYNLHISKNITGATTARGVRSAGTIQSDVTTDARMYESAPSTQATAFTLTTLNHFFATQGTIGATSTVTNQYGFNASSGLTGATNNFGFYSNIASGTGRWNFYANGTADNYFAGQVQLGAGTVSAPALSTTGDTNTGIYFPAADNIGFATNGVIRGRWTTDGLCFGSDTAAANALDDYEEGTWTPTDASAAGLTLTTQYARYTKIGNMVYFCAEITYPSNSDGNRVSVGGLPFTSNSTMAYGGFVRYTNSSQTIPTLLIGPSLTRIEAYQNSGSSFTNSQISQDRFDIVGMYQV